jgi:hypothetical protein
MIDRSQPASPQPDDRDPAALRSSAAAQPDASAPDQVVGRPADVPRVGWAPLGAWLIIPTLIAATLAVVFWLLPTLHSNVENKDQIGITKDDPPAAQR